VNHDPAARLIARLLALRFLPREDAEVRRLLVDAGFRDEVEQRLAASGMRLLANPFAEHVGIALIRECESAVFEQSDAWQASNIGLPKDAVALLVILWALIILPKRERQLAGETANPEQQQEMFETVKLTPLAHEASRGQLKRLGFIEQRNKTIQEGPLLDLAFDYAEMAPRVLQGALSDLLKQRGMLSEAEAGEAH
jgi:hypothetical protein